MLIPTKKPTKILFLLFLSLKIINMSTFRLHENGVIYLYHWITPSKPFKVSTGLKIEATKFTEVGFVGRDVDSIVRDLLEVSIKLTHEQTLARFRPKA